MLIFHFYILTKLLSDKLEQVLLKENEKQNIIFNTALIQYL